MIGRCFVFLLVVLCGCVLLDREERGWLWEDVPEGVRNQFRTASNDIRSRTGWKEPLRWRVHGHRGTHRGTLCGEPMWSWEAGGMMIGGSTDTKGGTCKTIIGLSPEGTAQYLAVYHEVFQGLGMVNGKIKGGEHPRELLQFLPENVRCMWR